MQSSFPNVPWILFEADYNSSCKLNLVLAMHAFYINIPWIINKTEYNCSSRTIVEWNARGSVNLQQGFYFSITGTIFIIFYAFSLIGMFRAKLLHIPCYRLMFFNGFLDMLDIILGSLIVSYFHFTGAVYCSDPVLNLLVGQLVWSTWMATSVICIALGTNRVVEMIPLMSKCRSIFRGRKVYIWIAVSVTVWIVRPFITRPLSYNSHEAAFLFAPLTTDNAQWEIANYTPLLFPLHNILFPIVQVLLYSVLCFYVFKIKGTKNGKLDKTQLQLFIQSFIICTSTAVASTFYVAVEFCSVSKSFVIFSNVMWQISHGIHGLVYMVVNKKIRGEVLRLMGLKRRPATISSVALLTVAKDTESTQKH